MAFVNDADIQAHLPKDKLHLERIPDDVSSVKLSVERIIRGYLAGNFEATTLAAWTDPDSTPGQIREIGGLLAAAEIYRLRYSEDSLDDPGFAQFKYAQAMEMLLQVISGVIVLDDVIDTGAQFDNTYFFPNNTTDDPKFTMDSVF